MMWETVLAYMTVLLGGANILQFIFIRSERKKAHANAEEAEADADRKKYELNKDQADYLIENLDKVNREYVELQRNIRESEAKHTQEILDKCKTIAELRSQVVYHKEFRCFKMDCKDREKKRTKDENEQEKEIKHEVQ